MTSETEFEVEAITDFREEDSDNEPVIEYRVKWRGFPDEQSTWEPVESLTEDKGTRRMVEGFNKHYTERILYKIRKYSKKGFSGIERVKECKFLSVSLKICMRLSYCKRRPGSNMK
ncbi:Oidioi.mRNA.OKI2018_I69.XSR.g16935.t1.cds [Oikopleura dioica]|uniref:Oidioi.mRNA.OKI2018_I69.XSR.g16935.t1.cds n=1 Tax=Oikopleura dioica TaxID=34765 RepID=A0ABN7SHN4_OIKDI|nr:Oidioi.mRNA.OKI2018_I69.XSR.g16935.t1.cds [Oikopleura dioica]